MDGMILANRSAVDRSEVDLYETPVEVTEALLDFLEDRDLLYSDIWEPACGRGRMAEVIRGGAATSWCAQTCTTTATESLGSTS